VVVVQVEQVLAVVVLGLAELVDLELGHHFLLLPEQNTQLQLVVVVLVELLDQLQAAQMAAILRLVPLPPMVVAAAVLLMV